MNNNIVVLGRVSVGKSTLLNSIVGQKYFQMGDGITTTEHSSYSLGKINLIDLPGNVDNTNLLEYSSIIQDAMAIIYVCDAQSVCNTLQMIPSLINIRNKMHNVNIFPVLNKIDEINDIESVRKEFNTVCESLGISKLLLIEVSAKLILLIKLFNSNSLNDKAMQLQLFNYVFGRNASQDMTIQDITQQQIKHLYKLCGYENIENFFQHYEKQSDNNLYMEIINNSRLLPIKMYLKALDKYKRENNIAIKKILINLLPSLVMFIFLTFTFFVVTAILLFIPYSKYELYGLPFVLATIVCISFLIFVILRIIIIIALKNIFNINYLYIHKEDITAIETTQKCISIIESYYVNSRYNDAINNPFIDFNSYIDKVYFIKVKYSDFVFVKLNNKIFQIHGIFSQNKILEVIHKAEVIQFNSKNKNPLRSQQYIVN
jgi:small GTP-binding protein